MSPGEIIPHRCYPTRVPSEIIDITVKIVHTGHRVILKTTREVWDNLNVGVVWKHCNNQSRENLNSRLCLILIVWGEMHVVVASYQYLTSGCFDFLNISSLIFHVFYYFH